MDDDLPVSIWHVAQMTTGAVLIVILLVLLFVLSGATDPRPIGTLIVQEAPISGAGWQVADSDGGELAAGVARLEGGPGRLLIRSPYTIISPGTVEIVVSMQAAPPGSDAGYGLWWGSPADYTAVRINRNGYLAVLSQQGGQVAGSP